MSLELLRDLDVLVDRGEVCIAHTNVRVEARGRGDGSANAEVELILRPGRSEAGERDYIHRLLTATQERRVHIRSIRRSYDEEYMRSAIREDDLRSRSRAYGGAEIEVEYITDTHTLQWIENGRCEQRTYQQPRRRRDEPQPQASAPSRVRTGLTGVRPGFTREILGEWVDPAPAPLNLRETFRGIDRSTQPSLLRPQAAPPPPPTSDDRVDALRYAMDHLGLSAEEVHRRTAPTQVNINIQRVEARDPDRFVADMAAMDAHIRNQTVQTYNPSETMRGLRADMVIIDDPAIPPGQVACVASSGQTVVLTIDVGCVPGEVDSHTWVAIPHEGPTAKRCSVCARVTGHFWSTEELRAWVFWLVDTFKPILLEWARTFDDSSIRYALLELDSSVSKATEPEPEDDMSKRFSLLELK